MVISTVFVAFADVTLELIVVGAVAVIAVIALALTLLSRSGSRDADAPPARAREPEQKKSAAPTDADAQSRVPALPRYGAAPSPDAAPAAAYPPQAPYAPPPAPPVGYAQSAPPAAPAPSTEHDGAPISTPWAPEQTLPPPAAQPSVPGGQGTGEGAPAPKPEAPSAPPPPPPPTYDAPTPIPSVEAEPSNAPEEPEPFAPSAGGAASDIDYFAMERELEQERASADRDDAEEAAPASPRRVPVVTPPSEGEFGGLPRFSDADQRRAEAPTAEELAAIEPAAGGDAADDERLRGITVGGANREQAQQAQAASAPTAAELQFTSFYPREIPTQQWQTLLVYTHVAEALNAVRADALKFAEELGERPRVMNAAASQAVERGTTLTIVPTCAGVRFNPERASLTWDEDWQRSNFRFSASEELAGSAAAGEIAIYVGPLILAILKFGVLIRDAAEPNVTIGATEQQTASPMTVFASYSHDDTPVALACRNAYKALGMTVNIDVDTLRSGDQWDSRLMQLIEGSDVFQLFWSARAANSEAVQREWRYALAHNRGAGYIRPVYWEQPLIAPPAELSNVHFAYIDLPRE